MSWNSIGGESAGNRSDTFVQIEAGKPKRVHALLEKGEEPVSYWSHWLNNVKQSVICPGKSVCPACKGGVQARMLHSMNVWDYDEKKVKILEKGNQVYESIKLYYEMGGNSLDAIDILIKQTGEGRDTKYVVASLPVGKLPPTNVTKFNLDETCRKTLPADIAKLIGEDPTSFEPEELEEETLDNVTAKSDEEIRMPTGKYKGKTLYEIVNIDRNYVEWVAENFTDEDIKEAATSALETSDRTPIIPAEKPKPQKRAKLETALNLIQAYQDKGGAIQDVAPVMREIAKKTIMQEFTDAELDTFIEKIGDMIESMEHE